ncbi:MAG: mechanosensitive ion channel [Pseudomonadales bacterium]|nr:mechanosensitive ion channel [Pseudomonadales bacterium]
MNELLPFLPLGIVLVCALIILGGLHWLLISRHPELGSEARLPRQLVLFLLSVVAVIVLIVASPLPESIRNQILALLGICISGAIAFASTSFVTNFMAAVMLRVTRPFGIGDFIEVGEFFGKVSERGLFDTEIQTENRELLAIPNALFISSPVRVVRQSGLIVSAEVSLGYDVHHSVVRKHLRLAAELAGLSEVFVHVRQLGDFSVTYRVGGLLENTETLLTSRSLLNEKILDALHEGGIQILSPGYMVQMPKTDHDAVLPQRPLRTDPEVTSNAEAVAFDKANEAEAKDKARQELTERMAMVKGSLKSAPESRRSQLEEEVAALEKQLQEFD